jgi:hypothetical protein
LSGLAGIIEQDHAAEAETVSERLQPRRDGLAEEAEDESSPTDMLGSAIRMNLPHYRGP